MAFRIDIGSVLRSPRRTADGALRVDATLTRTGVFTYQNADGSVVREYRPPEEVFKPESMASFEALPVTDDHPPVMVTAANLDEYKRGRSGDTIRRDGSHMVGGLIIEDRALQKKMDAGKREVSNGYECVLDPTPGVSPEGEAYDVIQREIIGNHVAIVDAGRAGSARVRMDGARMIDSHVAVMLTDAEVQALTASAVEKERSMNLEQALAALAAANEKLGAANARADKLEGERDSAAARATKADAERDAATKAKTDAEAAAVKAKTDAADAIPAMVKERAALVTKASLVLGADAKVKRGDAEIALVDAEPGELHVAVIEKVDGDKVPAGKSPAYIEGRFDAAYARADKSGKALEAAREILAPKTDEQPKAEVRVYDEDAARKQMIKDGASEWQKPAAPNTTEDKE